MKRISLLLVCLGFTLSVHAGEDEAREVFSFATSGALTFSFDSLSKDVSQSFIHFTSDGRSVLISELESSGVIRQAVGRRASLRTSVPMSRLSASRRVGSSGVDEFDIRGEAVLQWIKCDSRGCNNLGDSRKSAISGVVLAVNHNGRPGYRVSSVKLMEGAK